MSDTVLLAIITGLFSVIMAVINILAIALSRYLSHLEHLDTKDKVESVKTEVKEVKDQVVVIEKATNSMKDALMVATEAEAHARGIKEGTADEKARVADIEKEGTP